MIKISKQEMEYLSKVKKQRFPNPLHKTYSNRGNNRYYLTTNPVVMKMLEDYRKAKIIETKE